MGLDAAGFSVLAHIEQEPAARESLRLNGASTILEPGDINELALSLTPQQLGLKRGELGILAGGPPCQPFSNAAQWHHRGKHGLRDPRASCLSSFVRLIVAFAPRCVLIENVPGFASGRSSGLTWLKRRFAHVNSRLGTNYVVHSRVLDAADYGVPQHRRRLIAIAHREGLDFCWPERLFAKSPVTAFDAIHNVTPTTLPRMKGKWAELLSTIPEGHNYLYHTPQGDGRPLFGYRTRYWSFLLKLDRRKPSWTIAAQPGPSTGPFHWDNRPLAIEELLRLQSFPATLKVAGRRGDQVRQIGNATPPLLAEVLGRAIGAQYFGFSHSEPSHFVVQRAKNMPSRSRVRPVPAAFRSMEGAHEPHPGAGAGPRPRVSHLGR